MTTEQLNVRTPQAGSACPDFIVEILQVFSMHCNNTCVSSGEGCVDQHKLLPEQKFVLMHQDDLCHLDARKKY